MNELFLERIPLEGDDHYVLVIEKPDGCGGHVWAVELWNQNATAVELSRWATMEEAESHAEHVRLILDDIIEQEVTYAVESPSYQ